MARSLLLAIVAAASAVPADILPDGQLQPVSAREVGVAPYEGPNTYPADVPPVCDDGASYNDPTFTTTEVWGAGDCLGFMFFDRNGPSGCDNPRYLTECGYTEETLATARAQCPAACDVAECSSFAAVPVSLGGDPVFHSGDAWLKFRLKEEHKMTKILSWTQPSGRVYQLLGSTFSSKMKGSDQWFNKLAIRSNNVSVLEVDIGDRHEGKWFSKTMTVKVDGEHLDQESKYSHKGEFLVTLKPRMLKPRIGANQAERLLLHWGHGYEFEISSSLASAFPKHPDLQEKWAHLNVHFDKLPGGSTGLLAQFAGIEPMSESARALVVNTNQHGSNLLGAREHGVSMRQTAAKQTESCPVQCPGCPLSWSCEIIAESVEHFVRYSDSNDDFILDQKELDGVCEKSDWLNVLFAVTDPEGCNDFTSVLVATCDSDDSGDLDGCELLNCITMVENEYRYSKCPGFTTVSVETCTANDCLYNLNPDYATMFPSYQGCTTKVTQPGVDWAAFQEDEEDVARTGAPSDRSRGRLKLGVRAAPEVLSARLRERMRQQVVRDSPFNAVQMRNFFESFEDNYKRERDMV